MVAPIALGAGRAGLAFAKTPWGGRILAAGAGTLGGIAGMLLLGGKKGAAATAEAAAPVEQVATVPVDIDVPIEQALDTKKDIVLTAGRDITYWSVESMAATPETIVTPDITQYAEPKAEAAATAAAGTDLVTLALIGGGALIAYGYVTKE